MKRALLIIVALAAGFAIGRLTRRPEVRVETRTEYREIISQALRPASVSAPIGSRIERVKVLFLRDDQPVGVADTLPAAPDSAAVELPVRDYTFTDDSTYSIVARGAYVESLPEVRFFPIVTTSVVQTGRRTRFCHGLQAGAGAALTPEGLRPALYVGYGISLNF